VPPATSDLPSDVPSTPCCKITFTVCSISGGDSAEQESCTR
jgi:hypothetical protein